jgi:antibiotic biosynthesis monooxygenase (ABM) superfamily enzyme
MIVVVFKHRPKASVSLREDEEFMKELYLLAKHIPGFLSVSGYTAENGDRVHIEYFTTLEAVEQWQNFPEHVRMIQVGRERFYESYSAQVCTLVSQIDYPGDSSEVKEEKERG